MPRFDGTGPAGMGPMTGGGRGPCNPYGQYRAPDAPPAQPYYRGRPAAYNLGRPRWWLGRGFFRGRGRVQGRGRGWGRGRGRGRW
jgi:hypothetical protein